MNVFLIDKTTQLFAVQLYLCVYKFIFSETTYNLEPNGYIELKKNTFRSVVFEMKNVLTLTMYLKNASKINYCYLLINNLYLIVF